MCKEHGTYVSVFLFMTMEINMATTRELFCCVNVDSLKLVNRIIVIWNKFEIDL
jgi:hypothetical protein